MTTVRLWAYAHSPPRGVWGHAPPENFGNFDSLRVFLMHSGSSFGSELVAIFIRALLQTSRIMTELCCYNVIVWACDKMGGLSPPCFQSGGVQPPLPPLFLRPWQCTLTSVPALELGRSMGGWGYNFFFFSISPINPSF